MCTVCVLCVYSVYCVCTVCTVCVQCVLCVYCTNYSTNPERLHVAEQAKVHVVQEDLETPELTHSDKGHTEGRLSGEEVVVTLG